jgi:hypothetical protein
MMATEPPSEGAAPTNGTSSMAAQQVALRQEVAVLRHRLEDYQQASQGLPFENEALLFHELGQLARHPPYARTTRRKNILKDISFPDFVTYDPSVDRPLQLVTDEFRAETRSFGFCTLSMSPSELMLHWFVMFTELDLFAQLRIEPETLREFFRLVHNAYRDNAYHNFQHAMDVAQFAYAIVMSSERARQLLSPVDIFACLVLGLAHDMGKGPPRKENNQQQTTSFPNPPTPPSPLSYHQRRPACPHAWACLLRAWAW